MPGAALSLKRFACHPHAGQHQDSAAATRAVRAMTRQRLRLRANVRVKAGISEAPDALTYLRRTSTCTDGGAPAAVRGTWRWLSTPREAIRRGCLDVWR